MQAPQPCPRCGQRVEAPVAAGGGASRCPRCGVETPAVPSPGPTPMPAEETYSRSMLLRLPGLGAGPRGEAIARLEPGSLRWLDATEALGAALGVPSADLAGRSMREFLHPDDRGLAEDEFRQAAELGERHDFVLRLRGSGGGWRFHRIHT